MQVVYDGAPPPRKPFAVPADFAERRPEEAAFCGDCAKAGRLVDESLLVSPEGRGIRNVAVSVQNVPGDVKELPAANLDNHECRFEPRVGFVAVGSTVLVKNSDTFAHNARIFGRGNQEVWNAIVAPGKSAPTRPFIVTGTYSVICDVHPWMRATIIATRHPWVGVTGDDGRARIRGIPATGKTELVLWHEKLGTARVQVDLAGAEETRLTVQHTAFRAAK